MNGYEIIGRMVVWGIAGLGVWIAIGFAMVLLYINVAAKHGGCWSHAIGRTDRVARFMGWVVEGGGFLPGIFAVPILVPIGLYTLRRDGLYGKRRMVPAA